MELPAGGILGNFVQLWDFRSWRAPIKDLKSCRLLVDLLVEIHSDTLELLLNSPTKSLLLISPVQPQLVDVGLKTLKNPEEKVICSIKGKYSSIEHERN